MPTSFIIADRLLAEAPSRPFTYSALYICPRCGRQWAAVLVPGAEYQPFRAPCASHQWGIAIPGSISIGFIPGMAGLASQHLVLENLPRAVLEYELEVHLRYAEKGVGLHE